MKAMQEKLAGILLCFGIAIPSWFLGNQLPLVGSPVFGILFGMMLVFFYPTLLEKRHLDLELGVKYTSKKLLQYAIILLGFSMNLFYVLKVGGESLYVIIFTLSASFLTAFIMGKVLHIERNITTLIGVGTCICGGSAIMATAPVIKAKDEEVAHAISTIFLFNIIAVFIFPAMGAFWGMTDQGFGMWAGTAINDTSSVVAAGTAWSNSVGNNDALNFATIVKLTRTLMIVPITLILAIYEARKAKKQPAIVGEEGFSFVKIFPWFVIGFVFTALINTFFPIQIFSETMVKVGKFMIVMAMVAIGLNTNLKKLVTNGIKPIFLGVCCWVAVASVSLFVQKILHIW